MKSHKLLLALVIIMGIFAKDKKEVTAIQFEDGSGNKFNYQLDGGDWQFIDLTDKMSKL
jgi:hypothetical protein